MDYIQHRLMRHVEKNKKRCDVKSSTIVGYYIIRLQYMLYLMFACVWDKREPELSRSQRIEYLKAMERPQLGTILRAIMELERLGDEPVLNVNDSFETQVMKLITPRNTELAHGILIPGIQEESYKELLDTYEEVFNAIEGMNIPILRKDSSCRMYYWPDASSTQVTVFDELDYDYQLLSGELIRALEMQPNELYYYCDNVCYKISPFLILREVETGEDPFEIYCYQRYNLKNGKFEYKRYSDLSDNVSYTDIFRDYFMSFQEEFSHTICKANGVICNKFENNYDQFVATSPIDTHVQKVWDFIKKNNASACLTISGGGGLGKTALVQYICTKNIFESMSHNIDDIQYVIFCSAKDREYRQVAGLTAHIRPVREENAVKTYEDIIRIINWVLDTGGEAPDSDDIEAVEARLLETRGVLLIVDDFETLSEEDKRRVVALSTKLDLTKQKMIITTRSQYMSGEEYNLKELDREQTISFMRERYKQSCSQEVCDEFTAFAKEGDNKNLIYEITKGLPMLAIQLVNVLLLNGFKESSLKVRNNEELDDFLMGRLYEYFGNVTSKVLFVIMANFHNYGYEEVPRRDLRVLYDLFCRRMNLSSVDFDADIEELRKLNVIKPGPEYLRITTDVSLNVLNRSVEEIQKSSEMSERLYDNMFFKILASEGVMEGILAYSREEKAYIDEAFIEILALINPFNYTNDVRLNLIELYIAQIYSQTELVRKLFAECCKCMNVGTVEERFVGFERKYGFIIPELADRRDINVDIEESVDYKLQKIIDVLNEIIESMDDYILGKKNGASQSYCVDMRQTIRGKMTMLWRIRLAEVPTLNLEGCEEKIREIKDLLDEACYGKEFQDFKDAEEYQAVQRL